MKKTSNKVGGMGYYWAARPEDLPAHPLDKSEGFPPFWNEHRKKIFAAKEFRPDMLKNLVDWVNDAQAKGKAPEVAKIITVLNEATNTLEEAGGAVGAGHWLFDGDQATVLVQIWLSGGLGRIRLCAKCKTKWFFATRKDKRFCGKKCREASHWGTPETNYKVMLRERRYRKTLTKRKLATKREKLRKQIQSKIDAALRNNNIKVTVEAKSILLDGIVESESNRTVAIHSAMFYAGERNIVDGIKVGSGKPDRKERRIPALPPSLTGAS